MKKMFGKKLAFLLAAAVLAAGAFTSCDIGSDDGGSGESDQKQSVEFKKFEVAEGGTYYVNEAGEISAEEKDGYVFEVDIWLSDETNPYRCFLRKYTGSESDVSIPEGVTEINYQAFNRCESLESVVLPTGVDSLREYAFDFCEALKTVTIPNSVTEIDDGAFHGCESLTAVTYTGTKQEWKELYVDGYNNFVITKETKDGEVFLTGATVVTCKDGKLKYTHIEELYWDWLDAE